MSRPALEVADILRAQGNRFLQRYQSSISYQHLKAFRAVSRCRTASLGGHIDVCSKCGHQTGISYNSCRNRHCPKCQAGARQRWLEARQQELLDTGYFHVVFTVPHQLNVLALTSPAAFYDLLFSATAQTLLEVAANPKRLGADIGLLAILHTWGQNLLLHPHIHCLVPAGGLSPDRTRWIGTRHRFLLPIPALEKVFRGKFTAGLRRLYRNGLLRCEGPAAALREPKQFSQLLRTVHRNDWVVHAKQALGSPQHVLRYLGRYTHRVAISNHRILAFDGEHVTFRWKDYAHGGRQRIMTLDATEFLRRFFLHVLPRGFVRIRHYGLLSNRFRSRSIALARTLLAQQHGDDPIAPPLAPFRTHLHNRLALPDMLGSHEGAAQTLCHGDQLVMIKHPISALRLAHARPRTRLAHDSFPHQDGPAIPRRDPQQPGFRWPPLSTSTVSPLRSLTHRTSITHRDLFKVHRSLR